MNLPHAPTDTKIVDGQDRVTPNWRNWFIQLYGILSGGISQTVPLGKLTTGGTAGSLIIKNGIITAVTAPT